MNNASNESVKVTTASGGADKNDAVETTNGTAEAKASAPTIAIHQSEEVDPDLPLDITNNPTTNTEAKTNIVEDTQSCAYQRTPKFAILLSWNLEYFKTSVGLLRLVFMVSISNL